MIKNVFLNDRRTFWRKVHEIILALKVEKVLTKQQILEVYLNVIEFGPSVYGIKDASFHYFNKHPSELGPREAAFLAFLLPSPKGYYRSYRKKKLTPFAQERVKKILQKLRMAKIISPEEFEYELFRTFEWEHSDQVP
jgi:monofunctional glycosyltransferase